MYSTIRLGLRQSRIYVTALLSVSTCPDLQAGAVVGSGHQSALDKGIQN